MNDIEKRARELLAAELDAIRFPAMAAEIRDETGCNSCGAAMVRAVVAAITPPQGYVSEKPVLEAATQLRRLASAASPLARKAYIKAAETVEMAVSAARPEVSP